VEEENVKLNSLDEWRMVSQLKMMNDDVSGEEIQRVWICFAT
jgi:hypothetical protein